MPSNPMIPQGTLNRLRGSVNCIGNGPAGAVDQLNVTAPYLGKGGIALELQGNATDILPQLTGTVTSPAPFQMGTVTINILKTQNLSALWKTQLETNSAIGDIVVTPDTSALPTYTLYNCGIETVKPMTFNGEDAGMGITITGYYLLNNDLWNLT